MQQAKRCCCNQHRFINHFSLCILLTTFYSINPQIPTDTLTAYTADDTIISWNDPDLGTDIALSFQESVGCDRVWKHIIQVQDHGIKHGFNDHTSSNGYIRGRGVIDEFDAMPNSNGVQFDDVGPHHHPFNIHGGGGAAAATSVQLPRPELSSLKTIAKMLNESSLFQREALSTQLVSNGYLKQLLECFRTAEDIEDEESLAAVHAAVKAVVLLNDTNIMDIIFTDEYIMDVVGALEYDPDVPRNAPRIAHRKLISSTDALREVVPIKDAGLRSKIVQSFRMGYVKDAVLPKALDDATFNTLSSLQLFNNIEVLLALYDDEEFFPELFRRLREARDKESMDEWKDLVGYLQELTSMARHLQAVQRNNVMLKWVDLGLYNVLSDVLQYGDAGAKLKAADVLLAVVAHDPSPLRAFMMAKGNGEQLFGLLVQILRQPSEGGLQEQALEILKILLDPETMESSNDKDDFIDIFYSLHIGRLLACILDASLPSGSPHGGPSGANSGEQQQHLPASTIIIILELLCYCVTQHSYRIKYYILRNNIVEKVLRLLKRRETALTTAALRVLRTCVSLRDEFYNRYLVKNSLLEPVIAAFLANGSRYNLFNSAVLELFEFIRRENLKGLLGLIIESPQWEAMVEMTSAYSETLTTLKTKYDANQERLSMDAKGGVVGGGTVANDATTSGPGKYGMTRLDTRQHQDQQQVRSGGEEGEAIRLSTAAEIRKRKGEKEEDVDEENYFSREDEDDRGDGDSNTKESTTMKDSRDLGVGIKRSGDEIDHDIRDRKKVSLQHSPSPPPPQPPLPMRLVDYDDEDDEDDDDTIPLNGTMLLMQWLIFERMHGIVRFSPLKLLFMAMQWFQRQEISDY